MDYLDPNKQTRHRIIMLVGYVFIAIGIGLATLILLYQAYGFGLGKNGTVIQNGLVFFSSQPNPANIYLNGVRNSSQTNARIVLPAGIYHVQLSRNGYRVWKRIIEVQGGDVQHFDYPLLIPQKLVTKKLQTYPSPPPLVTQSPDRRWLLIEKPNSITDFSLYDLKNPTKAPTDISLPANLLSKASISENLQLEEWADDNQHIILQHNYDGKTEYILVDRTDPTKSQNLNTVLAANPTKLTLINKKYDQYYLYDSTTDTLQKASLSSPTPVTVLPRVLAYQSYSNDTLLYATDANAPAGKVLVKLMIGSTTYPIHSFPAGTNYLLDLTKYSGTLYVAAGATSQNKVYVYMDPVGQLNNLPNQAVVPSQVLHVTQPNYLSFSTSAQFIAVEGGNQFGVYDIENTTGYNYTTSQPIDTPQTHASWMDGDRLAYVSNGKLVIFDYDDTNQQTLLNVNSNYLPAFTPDYKIVYTLGPAAIPGQVDLDQTPLLIPADQ